MWQNKRDRFNGYFVFSNRTVTFWANIGMKNLERKILRVPNRSQTCYFTWYYLPWPPVGIHRIFLSKFLYCLPKHTLDNISSDMNLFYLLMQDYKTSQEIWCSIHVLINTDIHCTVYRFCHYGKMNNFFISLNSIITIIINLTEN